ncbi:MAG: DUF885 domain-containing protein [Steroidobacteraceae bacterium]
MSSLRVLGLCAGVLAMHCAGAQPQQSAHRALESLAQDMLYTTARTYPMTATFLGLPGHDGELEKPSEAFRAAQVARLQQWQSRLGSIIAGFDVHTSLVDRDDATLLQARLTASLDELLVYQADRKDYSHPANSIVRAVFVQFQHLPVVGQEGATAAALRRAWADIAARLAGAPAYVTAAARLVTMPCHLFGVVGARQLAGAPDFLSGALSGAAREQLGEKSADYARFVKARDAALTSIAQVKEYIDAHASVWPENYVMGRAAYDHMLKDEQLLPFDAADVERIGNDELAHGWAEEAWLQDLARRRGVALGAPSGGGLAPGGTALVGYYRERIAQLRSFVTDEQVVTIPSWLGTMQIVETPAFLQPVSPGASMNPPRLFDSSTTGYYYITPPKSLAEAAARLDMNEDFDRDRILSTAAHEALPGHFMQLSIARRHPDFVRRTEFSGVFAEGWAFYGEEMFVRLGLFGDDLDGRLFTARWERVRGARAIVDPKVASGEWTYDHAVEFFAAETGFTRQQAEAAVAGIATRPGYVIAYSVGRLQIENLLADYLRRMAGKGSLLDFHDRLLSYGTTPLAIVGPELLADLDKPASAVRAAANY